MNCLKQLAYYCCPQPEYAPVVDDQRDVNKVNYSVNISKSVATARSAYSDHEPVEKFITILHPSATVSDLKGLASETYNLDPSTLELYSTLTPATNSRATRLNDTDYLHGHRNLYLKLANENLPGDTN